MAQIATISRTDAEGEEHYQEVDVSDAIRVGRGFTVVVSMAALDQGSLKLLSDVRCERCGNLIELKRVLTGSSRGRPTEYCKKSCRKAAEMKTWRESRKAS